jgi:hypothetical protein
MVQIDFEINDLKTKEQKIKQEINFEKNQQKERFRLLE